MCLRRLCDRVRKKMCSMLSMSMTFASQIESRIMNIHDFSHRRCYFAAGQRVLFS